MIVPNWFSRELKIIDPLYFVEWNTHYEYWEIKRKMTERYVDVRKGIAIKFVNPTVGVFRYLNDTALNNLRERKYLSRRYPGTKYVDWLLSQAKDAKEKKRELALEMTTEGFMRIMNYGKSKMFDMKPAEVKSD